MSVIRLNQSGEAGLAEAEHGSVHHLQFAFNRATVAADPGWPAEAPDPGTPGPVAAPGAAAAAPDTEGPKANVPEGVALDPRDAAWLQGTDGSVAEDSHGEDAEDATAAGESGTEEGEGPQHNPTTFATLATTSDWFRSVLRSMLVSYAVGLAVLGAWLFTPLGWARLWVVPALSLPVVLRLAMHPLARRMLVQGLRVRRARLRSVAGIAAGTAAIAASLLTIDVVPRAIDSAMTANAGPVDVLVNTPSPTSRDAVYSAVAHHDDVALSQSRRGSAVVSESNDGQLDLTATAVEASSIDGRRVVTATAFETELARARDFGDDPAATGLVGVGTLAQDEAAVGADLADDLAIGRGDRVRVSFAGTVQEYRVAAVLPRRGLAALTLDSRSSARVLYVALGAVSRSAQGGADVRSLIAWSSLGDGAEGWKQSEVLASTVAAGIRESGAGELVSGVTVIARSADLHARLGTPSAALKRAADITAAILGAGGAFVILLTMLVTYRARRHDHLALRALGENRADAAGAAIADLWVLSLPAALLGAAAGHLIAGRVLAGASTRTHAIGRAAFTFSPRFAVLGASFAAGFGVAMLGLYLAARVGSRSSLARVVDRVETSAQRPKVMRAMLGAVGLVGAIGAYGFVRELLRWREARGFAAVLFVTAFLAATVAFVRIVRPWLVVWVLPLAAALLAAASLVSLAVGDDGPRGAASASASVIMAVCALTVTFALLAAAGRGVTSRLHAPRALRALALRIAPLSLRRRRLKAVDESRIPTDVTRVRRRRARARVLEPRTPRAWSGQLVVLFVSLLAVTVFLASQVNAATAHRISDRAELVGGRFDAVVADVRDLASFNAASTDAGVVEAVGVRGASGIALATSGVGIPVRFGVIDAPYAESAGVFALTGRHAGGDQSLVMSVLTGENAVLVDAAVAARLGVGDGQRVSLVDLASGTVKTFAVAGLLPESAGLPDVVIGEGGFDALHPSAASDLSVLVRLRGGGDVGQLRSLGMKAQSFTELVRAKSGMAAVASVIARLRALAYFFALAGLLALLGVWLWERRSELGTMRALGAPDSVIAATVVREQVPRLVEGVLIGTLVSLAAVAGIVASSFDSRMAITWLSPQSYIRDVAWVVVLVFSALTITTLVLLRDPRSLASRR